MWRNLCETIIFLMVGLDMLACGDQRLVPLRLVRLFRIVLPRLYLAANSNRSTILTTGIVADGRLAYETLISSIFSRESMPLGL